MKTPYLQFIIPFFLWPAGLPPDPIDNVADLIRKGNIHELSKSLSLNTEIIISNEENTYSRAGAELMLNKFFSENKPRSVKILHKVNSNAKYRCGVVLIASGKESYRLIYILKETAGNFELIEIRIEDEKPGIK